MINLYKWLVLFKNIIPSIKVSICQSLVILALINVNLENDIIYYIEKFFSHKYKYVPNRIIY